MLYHGGTFLRCHSQHAELVRPDEKGDPEQFFMDESQMGPQDYQQVIQSHKERARHHSLMAKGYRLRAEKRFGKP